MKKFMALLLGVTLMLSAVGCASQTSEQDLSAEAQQETGAKLAAFAVKEAVYPQYPELVDYAVFTADMDTDSFTDEQWDQVWQDYQAALDKAEQQLMEIKKEAPDREYLKNLGSFSNSAAAQILLKADSENPVFSPLSLYMALAGLSELTDGTTRQQIYELIGNADAELIRSQSNALWRSLYTDDGVTTVIPSSSLWLNEGLEFADQPISILADEYFTSVYEGKFGSDEMNEALQTWLNESTGGMLEKQAADIETASSNENGDANALMLLSTLYFCDQWDWKFNADQTQSGQFVKQDGTEVTCDYMYCITDGDFVAADGYNAARIRFAQGGSMLFIRPDDGVSPQQLLENGVLDELLSKSPETIYGEIRWAIPKFDIEYTADLKPQLQEMGITQAFERDRADFSPLSSMPLYLDKATQSTRVTIDENGCTAASFVMLEVAAGEAFVEEKGYCDMTLDRPFIFVISSGVGQLSLFVGIVGDPS